ncbi:MAG: hypothetical protein RSA98_05515 [Odoribacter sp.]
MQINGNIVIENASPEGARVVLYKNSSKISEINITKKGAFDFKLALNGDYRVAFEKDGYITKNVSVNTEIPEEVIESNPNFPPVKLIINLLPTVEGVDLSIFDQPVAILAYNQELDDFTFDKEYSDKIKTRVAQTEQSIKRQLNVKGAAALEQERQFAELVGKGQRAFEQKEWSHAIESWTLALNIKPSSDELKQKITNARKEAELEEARRSIELQNERAYKYLIASADSLLGGKNYLPAKEKYLAAVKLNNKDTYPGNKIREIEAILAAIAQKEANAQQQREANEAAYHKAIAAADQSFSVKEYAQAISTYRQALEIKKGKSYPKERIAKAELAIVELEKQQAAEAERKRLEEERRNSMKNRYAELIAEADNAFKNENYGLAKLRYTDADNLNLEEEYPKKQLQAINQIINSSKYQAKLAEFNKNKALAEKNMLAKNYASAKVYYQNAISILPLEKEVILNKIAEIEKEIEIERLAVIEKEYKAHLAKADKAYEEKAYAVAKFYYQKALEAKNGDAYATQRLQEMVKYIGERQEKEAEL